MTTNIIVRVDAGMKDRFARLAKAEGKAASEVVRDLMATYVAERDIGAYLDGLWERTGKALRARGKSAADVARAVREVRGTRR